MTPLLFLLVPLLLVGIPFTWVVVKFTNSPIMNGSIPAWALIVVIFVVLYVYKNRYAWGLSKRRY